MILFEINIFNFYFILEKSQGVIFYAILDIIFVFKIKNSYIHTHILKLARENVYVFQLFFRVLNSDEIFFNVAL